MITNIATAYSGGAHERPDHLADRDLGDAHRRRQHAVVGLRVVQLEEDVEDRLEHRPVHRGGGEQRRRDEGDVGDSAGRRPAGTCSTMPPMPEADPDQVEDRLEDAAEDDDPLVAVDHDVALDQAPRAPDARPGGRERAGRDGQPAARWSSSVSARHPLRESAARRSQAPIAEHDQQVARGGAARSAGPAGRGRRRG